MQKQIMDIYSFSTAYYCTRYFNLKLQLLRIFEIIISSLSVTDAGKRHNSKHFLFVQYGTILVFKILEYQTKEKKENSNKIFQYVQL